MQRLKTIAEQNETNPEALKKLTLKYDKEHIKHKLGDAHLFEPQATNIAALESILKSFPEHTKVILSYIEEEIKATLDNSEKFSAKFKYAYHLD